MNVRQCKKLIKLFRVRGLSDKEIRRHLLADMGVDPHTVEQALSPQLFVQTPIGNIRAPAGMTTRMASLTKDELFQAVDDGRFIAPEAMAEVDRRDLLADYYRWKEANNG